MDNNLFNTDKEKAGGLIKDHFVSNERERKVDKKEVKTEDEEVEGEALNDIVTNVKITLSRTQNMLKLK